MGRGGPDLLILKLTIVPLGLLLFGIVERLHGPRVAGWLAGFPIVGGPRLLFITLDHGLCSCSFPWVTGWASAPRRRCAPISGGCLGLPLPCPTPSVPGA